MKIVGTLVLQHQWTHHMPKPVTCSLAHTYLINWISAYANWAHPGSHTASAKDRHFLKVEKKINNLLKVLESSGSSSAANRLKALEAEKADIEQQLSKIQGTTIRLTPQNCKEIKKQLYKFFSTSDAPEVRTFLKSVIREVKIDNDSVSFTLNYPTYK